MRALIGLTLAAAAAVTTAAAAQGTEGPLAGPDPAATVDASPSGAAPTKHGAAHRAKTKTAHARTAVPMASRLPAGAAALPDTPALPTSSKAPTVTAKSAPPTDPISFGMNWNAANQSGRETRIENLNGDATGVGGTLGMKLHF